MLVAERNQTLTGRTRACRESLQLHKKPHEAFASERHAVAQVEKSDALGRLQTRIGSPPVESSRELLAEQWQANYQPLKLVAAELAVIPRIQSSQHRDTRNLQQLRRAHEVITRLHVDQQRSLARLNAFRVCSDSEVDRHETSVAWRCSRDIPQRSGNPRPYALSSSCAAWTSPSSTFYRDQSGGPQPQTTCPKRTRRPLPSRRARMIAS